MTSADRAGRSHGRPRKISVGDIVQAVLDEGFTDLTLPAVANRLGVTPMTLYRYVPVRAELLTMAWDHILEHASWPGLTEDWYQSLHDHATTLWHICAEHPGSVTELTQAPMSHNMMSLYDDLAAHLVELGFTPENAVLAVDLVIDLTLEHRRGAERLDGMTTPAASRDQLAQTWHTKDADQSAREAVRRSMAAAINAPPHVWFHRKLHVALRGIASELTGEETPTHWGPCGPKPL